MRSGGAVLCELKALQVQIPAAYGSIRDTIHPMRSTLSLAALCLASLALSQSYSLRLIPPKGAKVTMTTSVTMRQSLKASGPATKGQAAQGMNMDMDQKVVQTMSVVSTSAKGVTIKTSIDDVRATAPAGSMMAGQVSNMQQMKGTSFEGTYDARGRSVGKLTASGVTPQVSQMMNRYSGFGVMGFEYPAGPVHVGSKWSSKIDFAQLMGGMMPGMIQPGKASTVPMNFRIVRFERRGSRTLAHIGYTMKGKMDFSMNAQQGKPMKLDLDTDAKGTIVVDSATGLPVEGSSTSVSNIAVGTMARMVQNLSVSMRSR